MVACHVEAGQGQAPVLVAEEVDVDDRSCHQSRKRQNVQDNSRAIAQDQRRVAGHDAGQPLLSEMADAFWQALREGEGRANLHHIQRVLAATVPGIEPRVFLERDYVGCRETAWNAE